MTRIYHNTPDAGVTLEKSISGVGESAMLGAVEAIAAALGLGEKYIIHKAHA